MRVNELLRQSDIKMLTQKQFFFMSAYAWICYRLVVFLWTRIHFFLQQIPRVPHSTHTLVYCIIKCETGIGLTVGRRSWNPTIPQLGHYTHYSLTKTHSFNPLRCLLRRKLSCPSYFLQWSAKSSGNAGHTADVPLTCRQNTLNTTDLTERSEASHTQAFILF